MASTRVDFKQQVEEKVAAVRATRDKKRAERARGRQLIVEEQKEADISKRIIEEESNDIESTRTLNVERVPSPTYKIAGLIAKKRKRTASAEDDGEEKENIPDRHPDAPRPKAPRSKVKQIYTKEEELNIRWRSAEWYAEINPAKTRKDLKRSDEMAIAQYFRSEVRDCIEAQKIGKDTSVPFSRLRTRIHEMEFYRFLDRALIKKSKILEPHGLRQIIDGPDNRIFPYDIRADAEVLWRRWMSGDLDYLLLRGIITKKKTASSGQSRISDKLDKSYEWRKSANEVGSNGLINGQWWPTRLAVLRDGGHGAQEAGIHGQTGKGAYSIVIASSEYGDEDKGEVSPSERFLPRVKAD
jgi:hypothetical protein